MKVELYSPTDKPAEPSAELELIARSGGGITLVDRTRGVSGPNVLYIGSDGVIHICGGYTGALPTGHGNYVKSLGGRRE